MTMGIPKKIKWTFLLSALSTLLFFIPFPLSAQTTPASKSSDLKLKPINIHFATLGGLQYSIGDEPLVSYQQFEDLIYPLRDFESSRLLKKSESSDLNSKIFGGIGVAGLLTGLVGLLSVPSNQQTPFWITAVGGAVSLDIGGLFGSEAQTAKFNCAQRFNRFARGEEQILPQGPSDEKSLMNFDHEPVKQAATPSDKN